MQKTNLVVNLFESKVSTFFVQSIIILVILSLLFSLIDVKFPSTNVVFVLLIFQLTPFFEYSKDSKASLNFLAMSFSMQVFLILVTIITQSKNPLFNYLFIVGVLVTAKTLYALSSLTEDNEGITTACKMAVLGVVLGMLFALVVLFFVLKIEVVF